MEDLPKAQIMELASLNDLLRLVVSIMGRTSISGHLYYAEKDGKHYFLLTNTVNGWYEYYGLPVTLLAEHDSAPTANFIEYQIAKDGNEESFKFVEQVKQSTTLIQIPIITLKEVPEFML